MKRSRLIVMLSLLSLYGMLFLGCGGEPNKAGQLTAPRPIASRTDANEYLDSLNLDYEEFAGTLTPGVGGVLNATMTTWGKNCQFSLFVPATAVDPEGSPINFTMRIPTKASYLAHPEIASKIIVRFEPNGEHFSDSLTVQTTWMPWEGVPPDSLYYWCIYGEGVPTVTYLPNINRYRVTYKVNHFSDWEVGPEPPREPTP